MWDISPADRVRARRSLKLAVRLYPELSVLLKSADVDQVALCHKWIALHISHITTYVTAYQTARVVSRVCNKYIDTSSFLAAVLPVNPPCEISYCNGKCAPTVLWNRDFNDIEPSSQLTRVIRYSEVPMIRLRQANRRDVAAVEKELVFEDDMGERSFLCNLGIILESRKSLFMIDTFTETVGFVLIKYSGIDDNDDEPNRNKWSPYDEWDWSPYILNIYYRFRRMGYGTSALRELERRSIGKSIVMQVTACVEFYRNMGYDITGRLGYNSNVVARKRIHS